MEQMKLNKKRIEKKHNLNDVSISNYMDFSGEKKQELKKMRLPRTRKYLNEVGLIDELTDNDCKIIESIQNLPENNKLLGVLAECKLSGYVIHAIDKCGNVIEHYHLIEELPKDLQCGYSFLKENKDCLSVEIYTNTICIIFDDGCVEVIERE